MNTLQKPKFKNLNQGNGAGAPVLKGLWDKFDLSLLLTQCGINKHSGTPAWIIVFAYIAGLTKGCTSVLSIAKHACEDKILKPMFGDLNVTQCSMSRFFTKAYDWYKFSQKRVEKLQQDSATCLTEGDVITLDDTKVTHPFGEKIPFLCWLFDSSDKVNIWCMNIVATFAVLKNGLEYPLFHRIWRKVDGEDEKQTKIDLSMQMLEDIRKSFKGKLWVAMDRWFLCKELFQWLVANNYDWVTKAKRNTALYRREIERVTGRERFVPVKPGQLIREVFLNLLRVSANTDGLCAISIPEIHMKLPFQVLGKRGKIVTKQKLVPIAAVVAMRLKEDIEKAENDILENTEDAATYRGAYLIISNRFDIPEEALNTYVKRWRIEVFFRTAKQELGLTNCHSTSEAHHHAHIELLFTAETLLSYAKWELNDNEKGIEEGFTHGEMVRNFFNAQYSIALKTIGGFKTIQIYFDIDVRQFARLLDKFWPQDITLRWLPDIQLLPRTA